MGKCSEKLQYEVQKCTNFSAKVATNRKYLKQDQVTPLLRDLKWINFNSILRLNEASFMYKNLHASADLNVKKINFIIIIIIIKKGQQCSAGRECYTPYQSEDPSPTIPTYRQKEEKGKESRRL